MHTHNLPPQPTPFVGRSEELAEVARLLADPACRLLTLVGPGGIGKTRLATQVARHSSFPAGSHFVPLQPLTSPDYIVPAIVTALGLQFTPGSEPRQQLLDYLCQWSLLLVLDNLEHLLEGVQLLSDILEAAPDVRLLVTSRERLNLREEWVLEVGGLKYPVTERESQSAEYDAVELFVQHARHAKVDFMLTEALKPTVIRICHLLGGMPLAIELAATWIRALTCEAIAEEINYSLDILDTPARNIESRHHNMRAAFEPTWKRLTEEERSVFTRLSVFRGGFTRQAAGQVAGASLHTLSALVDKSLLRMDASGRYDLHELLRQYGEEQLNTIQHMSEAARNSHGAYYAEFLHEKWMPLRTSHQRKALDDIVVEIDNVRAAWRHMVGKREIMGIDKALGSLWYFHDLLDRNQEGFELLGQAIESLRANSAAQDAKIVLSQLLARHGWFYSSAVGLHSKGQLVCEEGLMILQRLGKREEMVAPLDSLCLTSIFAHDYVKLRQAAQEGLQIAEESHEAWWIGRFLYWLTLAAKSEQEYTEARKWGEKCLEIAEDIGDLWLLGLLYSVGLGEVAYAMGDFVEAKHCYLRGLSAVEQLGMPWGIGKISLFLGRLTILSHQHAEAANYYHRSLKLYQEIGQTWEIIDTLAEIATLQMAQGRTAQAVEIWTLIAVHPATPNHILERTERSLTELASDLAPHVYAAAHERGKELKLGKVVAEFLNHVEVTDSHSPKDETLTEPLTTRELDILRLIADGLNSREIADKLVLSVGTVRWYLRQIYDKLDAHTRADVIAQGRALKLLD